MQKKFLGNLLFIILLNVLIKPFYIFGIDVQVQNIVGSESYGMYFSLLNFSFLFNMFLDIGVTNYNTKNTVQHPTSLTKYRSEEHTSELQSRPHLVFRLLLENKRGYS